eukprot:SAG31_NODE_6410_length_2030_cov_1.110306_1_plen_215_part_00
MEKQEELRASLDHEDNKQVDVDRQLPDTQILMVSENHKNADGFTNKKSKQETSGTSSGLDLPVLPVAGIGRRELLRELKELKDVHSHYREEARRQLIQREQGLEQLKRDIASLAPKSPGVSGVITGHSTGGITHPDQLVKTTGNDIEDMDLSSGELRRLQQEHLQLARLLRHLTHNRAAAESDLKAERDSLMEQIAVREPPYYLRCFDIFNCPQ